MARQRRRGSLSKMALARQKVFGEHVTTFDAPSGSGASRTAGFIQRLFPFTRNTLIPDAEIVPSESIIGLDAEAEDQIGIQNAAGDWEFELLPESIIHLLLGWFNPDSPPTNTAVPDKTIAAADITNTSGVVTVAAAVNERMTGADASKFAFNYPGQLEITLPSGTTGTIEGKLEGYRRGSRPTSHRKRFYETEKITFSGTTAKLTKNHYFGISKLTLPSSVTDKPTIVVKPDTQYCDLTLNTTGLQFPGWTGQMRDGISPVAGFDIVPNGFAINISNNARLLMNVIASWVINNRIIDNMDTASYSLPTSGNISDFTREKLNFFQAWGQALAIGDVDEAIGVGLNDDGTALSGLLQKVENDTAEIIATTDLSLAGTHNYVDPEGNTGSAFQDQPIVDANAVGNQVNLNTTIFDETDDAAENNTTIDWEQRFFSRSVMPIVMRMYNWASDGRQYIIEARIPRFQLTTIPGKPIEGRGQLNRTLAGKALPSENATSPDQISIRIYSEHGFLETAA